MLIEELVILYGLPISKRKFQIKYQTNLFHYYIRFVVDKGGNSSLFINKEDFYNGLFGRFRF